MGSDKKKTSVEDNDFRCSLESVEGGVEVHPNDWNCVEVHRAEAHGDPCDLERSH